MAQLGIDPAEIVSGGAHRTWVGISAYGRTGPWANRVGFGDDVAISAGLVAVDPASGTTVPCGDAIADPLTGVHAAVAALACVIGGGSRVVDIAMRDIVAATLDDRTTTETASVVERPRMRPATQPAAPIGAHTEPVLAELGLR
jgi:crotonobetainyl-CoA:carnitine CoA-transferase CaiB-like acyl-CoA transferase